MEPPPNRIREIRERRKSELPSLFTQQALSTRLGIDGATLRRWESGTTTPTKRNLRALARELGVTADELGTTPQYPAGDVQP
jgi:transcriptional regulator with XRE-family HTH domain